MISSPKHQESTWSDVFVIFAILGVLYIFVMILYLVSTGFRRKRIVQERMDSRRTVDKETGAVYEETHRKVLLQDETSDGCVEDEVDQDIITKIEPVNEIPPEAKDKTTDHVQSRKYLLRNDEECVVGVSEYKRETSDYVPVLCLKADDEHKPAAFIKSTEETKNEKEFGSKTRQPTKMSTVHSKIKSVNVSLM